jgi:hypothetical protein
MCQEHLDTVLKSTMKYSAYAIPNVHAIKWENTVNSKLVKVSTISLLLDAGSKYFSYSISKYLIESNACAQVTQCL